MSGISPLFTKLICLHFRGGVTAGGGDRMTGDSIALLSAALAGLMQVSDVRHGVHDARLVLTQRCCTEQSG